MKITAWWAAWRADRRHRRLWHQGPIPCPCQEQSPTDPKETSVAPKPTVRTPETLRAAMAVTCPSCGATANNRCRKGTTSRPPHDVRIKAGTDE